MNKLQEALEVHEELNPVLWNGMELKEEVKDKLLEIADTFIESLSYPINVADIRFLGSNASFNYNNNSDIDLHIISNFDLVYVSDDILQTLYNASKNSFNNNHDISIHGIPVELYIEDMKSTNATNGSYSLLKDEWVMIPKPVEYVIPDYSKELMAIKEEINKALSSTDKETVENLINEIYLGRKDGLMADGEASIGNCVFKELRNEGLIEKLRERFYELESQELTLENKLTESVDKEKMEENELRIEKESEYKDYIDIHRKNVRKAYDRIVSDIIRGDFSDDELRTLEENIDMHDKDKFIPFMFDAYRRDHHPINDKEEEEAQEDYAIAWDYHKHNNPHHWEYWLNSNGDFALAPDLNAMKLAYAEMLCDWLSFGFRKDEESFTGESNEFSVWYADNKDIIKIHPDLKEWFDNKVETVQKFIEENKNTIYESFEKHLTKNETYSIISENDVNTDKEVENMSGINKIEEGGLSRVLQLLQEGYFGLVSGELSILRFAFYVMKDEELLQLLNNDYDNYRNLDNQEEIEQSLDTKYGKQLIKYNKEVYSHLKEFVRSAGYGFIPVDGVYTYNGGPESVEKSLLVSQPKESRNSIAEFKSDILNIGKSFYQESVVIGNSAVEQNSIVDTKEGEDTKKRIKVDAALYDCATGNILQTEDFDTEFNAVKMSDFENALSRLKTGGEFTTYKAVLNEEYTDLRKPKSFNEALLLSSVREQLKQNYNKFTEGFKRKLQEMDYADFKKEYGFKYDYKVQVPLKLKQQNDFATYGDNDYEMDLDIDSLYDEFDEVGKQIESWFSDEDYLKEIFEETTLGRVYPELIEINEDEMIFNIGFSDYEEELPEQDVLINEIYDLAENIIDNIDWLSVKQYYTEYTGDVDEDNDPIEEEVYSDDTVSLQIILDKDKDISVQSIKKESLTESKEADRMKKWVETVCEGRKLEESSMSKVAEYISHYQVGFITAFRQGNTKAQNQDRNAQLKLDILQDLDKTRLSYIKVDGTYPEVKEGSENEFVQIFEETFAVINDQYRADQFIDIMCALCKKYNQDSVLIVFPPANAEKKIEDNITAAEYDGNGNKVAEYRGFTVSAYDKYKDKNTDIEEYYTKIGNKKLSFSNRREVTENIDKEPEFDVLTYRLKKKGNQGSMLEAQNKSAYVKKILEELKLEESSMSRLLQHANEGQLAFITGYRTENNRKENSEANNNLSKDLQSAGLSFSKVGGGFVETIDPETREKLPEPRITEEVTFAVYNNKYKPDDFMEIMTDLCGKYNQEAVLVTNPSTDKSNTLYRRDNKPGLTITAFYLDRDGNVVNKFNGISLNNIEDYYTKVSGKKFKFTESLDIPNETFTHRTNSVFRVVMASKAYEDYKKSKLEESGTSRLVQLAQEGYFATISAELSVLRYARVVKEDSTIPDDETYNNLDKEEQIKILNYATEKYGKECEQRNKEADDEIRKDIRSMDWGYVQLEGKYTYADGTVGYEKSYFISEPKTQRGESVERFRDTIIGWGRHFNQESVIVGKEDKSDNKNTVDFKYDYRTSNKLSGDEEQISKGLSISAGLYDCETGEEWVSFDGITINDLGNNLSRLMKGTKESQSSKRSFEFFTESLDKIEMSWDGASQKVKNYLVSSTTSKLRKLREAYLESLNK